MPQVGDVTSCPTGPTNVMSGKQFERMGGNGGYLKLYGCCITAAATLGEMKVTLMAGSETLCSKAVVRLDQDGVVVPDHQLGGGVALPGDQIIIEVQQDNAAARSLHWLLDVENA